MAGEKSVSKFCEVCNEQRRFTRPKLNHRKWLSSSNVFMWFFYPFAGMANALRPKTCVSCGSRKWR